MVIPTFHDDDAEGKERPVEHAELRGHGDWIMLGSSRPDSPYDTGKHSVYVVIDGDVDAHCERARAAGAEIIRAPEDQDYGGRDYTARDPEGNVWSFGTYAPGS